MRVSDPHDRPQPDGSDRRLATGADVEALAPRLAAAFQNTPGMGWTFRDPGKRLHRLTVGFALYLREIWLPGGACHTTDRLAGAACWLPPGNWHLPISTQLRLLPRVVAHARGDVTRLMRWQRIAEGKHPREPHWYLALLGVDPALQGRGYGPHLMRPALDRCDSDRLPAYLETDTEANVALYERHGFAVTERFELPGNGPPVWLMWREPG